MMKLIYCLDVEIIVEQKWNDIAITNICKKWSIFMAHCMETNPDNSPKSLNLKEVFHIT